MLVKGKNGRQTCLNLALVCWEVIAWLLARMVRDSIIRLVCKMCIITTLVRGSIVSCHGSKLYEFSDAHYRGGIFKPPRIKCFTHAEEHRVFLTSCNISKDTWHWIQSLYPICTHINSWKTWQSQPAPLKTRDCDCHAPCWPDLRRGGEGIQGQV